MVKKPPTSAGDARAWTRSEGHKETIESDVRLMYHDTKNSKALFPLHIVSSWA